MTARGADAPSGSTKRRPDLFIVGAPKSGTTSLYEYLRDHPDVFMSSVKEPMYFSPDVHRRRRERFEYGRDDARYLDLFSGATTEKRVGEASTHYLSSGKAAVLIRAFEPDARIVCILRNPVEVAYAWHGERVFRGDEGARNFDMSLLKEERGARYFEIGRYGAQLTRWFDVFGRDRVHTIIFDDFVRDTPAEFERLLRFLDVDLSYRPASFVAHNAVTSKSPLVPWLRRRPVKMASAGLRRIAGEGVTRRLSRTVRSVPLVNRRGPRAPMPEEVRSALTDAYRDDVELAGRLLDTDLGALWFD